MHNQGETGEVGERGDPGIQGPKVRELTTVEYWTTAATRLD